jgi:hypothetical protein
MPKTAAGNTMFPVPRKILARLHPADIRLVPGSGAGDVTRRRFAETSGGAPPDG